MTRKALLIIEADKTWDVLTEKDLVEMLKENEECSGIKVTQASILNEAAIMDVLLKHGEFLTCFSCGKSLTEVDDDRVHEHGKDRFIAKLVLEPGENNYPREPDIPAGLYFVCSECEK